MSIFLGYTSAVEKGWNYEKNGADWAKLTDIATNECGTRNQSPIDLPMEVADDKIFDTYDDNFNKIYTDQTGSSLINWDGHTSITTVTNEG